MWDMRQVKKTPKVFDLSNYTMELPLIDMGYTEFRGQTREINLGIISM